eukprot:350390_1
MVKMHMIHQFIDQYIHPEKKHGFSMLYPHLFQKAIYRARRGPKKDAEIPTKLYRHLLQGYDEHTLINYKIRNTYHHLGCKKFHQLENCIFNHESQQLDDEEMKICPPSILIPRENGEKFMKYQPLNANKDLFYYGIQQHNQLNPLRDFGHLFKKHMEYSFRNDLNKVRHINPTKILKWETPAFTPQTREQIQKFYDENPCRLTSIEAYWIKEVKSKPVKNAITKIINQKILQLLTKHWTIIWRNKLLLLNIDDCQTDEQILSQVPLGRLKSIIEAISEETETEDISSIKSIIRLIKSQIQKQIKKEEEKYDSSSSESNTDSETDSDSSTSTDSDTNSD